MLVCVWWRVCAACRGIAQCDACRQRKVQTELRAGQGQRKSCQLVVCSHCGPKSPAAFSKKDRSHYFDSAQNAQCSACKAAGRNTKDGAHRRTTTPTCDACGEGSTRRSCRARGEPLALRP